MNKYLIKSLLVLILIFMALTPIINQNETPNNSEVLSLEPFITPTLHSSNYEQYSKGNFSGFECSKYNLSVFLSEETSTVAGNLTIDYYNDDPINFSQIPFHLYPSGMEYDTQPGFIEILNVTTLDIPKMQLPFEVLSDQQLMWVNLSTELESEQRVSFCISFNTTLPDGGIDRANVHGDDINQDKIFKFASCYPMPCVYDDLDGWNIDPYLLVGDPFYFDMAYYNLIIDVPEEMVIAATGELTQVHYYGNRKVLQFDPHFPVREVTFSASRYFNIESNIVNGVNISTYFLPSSYSLWHNWCLEVATQSFTLYNDTLGIYPYNTFNVVEEHTKYGGMEYPLQIYTSSKAYQYDYPEYALELGIAHETAHQWFYNMVGVDEVDWGFLDEGLVVWITDYFRDIRHPTWNLFEPYRYLDTVREYNITDGLPNKINQSVYDAILIDPDVYWDSAYIKAPTILDHLRRTTLQDDFIPSLRLFFQSHYFEIATLSDLKDVCETVYGYSLDWFFSPWFNNPYLPKYAFTNVIYDAETNIINMTISDLNELLHEYSYTQKIQLEIYYRGGHLEISERVWVNNTNSIYISIENTPEYVVLIYDNEVLVQLTYQGQSSIFTWEIEIINQDEEIPGFNLIIIVSIIMIFGIIISLNNRRVNKSLK